jgi:hypothetical protein
MKKTYNFSFQNIEKTCRTQFLAYNIKHLFQLRDESLKKTSYRFFFLFSLIGGKYFLEICSKQLLYCFHVLKNYFFQRKGYFKYTIDVFVIFSKKYFQNRTYILLSEMLVNMILFLSRKAVLK